ncbi:MAG TPA: efflux RND transporter periplasmic adaptor subunit [Noviherbaspirillum sp.]|nr:efflux RND transporter periplasmic adaptor subunit [Noviherbaspirillum sp.]
MKRFKRKTFTIAVIALLIAVVTGIAIFLAGQSQPDDQKTATAKPALTVTTVRPAQTRLPIRLAANGNIAAWQEASIGSESNGLRLSEVRVNVGDAVRAGQVLAVFAVESVEADVAQARANLMEAEATAADAAANAAGARTLQETGALSAQQINQYLTAEQTAKARVAAAKATLAAQQLRMRHVQVLAPDSGVISERKATVGAVAGAGTELFRMIRKGRLEWRAEVTSSELARLQAGTPAVVTAANGARLQGKVRMIGPTVDPQNRSALVYVDLLPVPAQASPAKAGMFARGEFDLGTSTAQTVPQQAVVLRDGFSYLFRLGPGNRVSQLKVRTGRRINDQVELLDPIAPDTVIVANGAGFLNEGDFVRVVEDTRPSSPGSRQGQPS